MIFLKKKRNNSIMKIVYSVYIFQSELYNNIMLMNSLYKDNIHVNNNNNIKQ